MKLLLLLLLLSNCTLYVYTEKPNLTKKEQLELLKKEYIRKIKELN